MSKPKDKPKSSLKPEPKRPSRAPNILREGAEFCRDELGIAGTMLALIFSPALIVTWLTYALIRTWENLMDGDAPRPDHTSSAVILVPYLVLPFAALAWAIVVVLAVVTVGYRLFPPR